MLIYCDAGHGYNTPGKRTPDGEREWTFNDIVVKAFINQMNNYKNVTVVRVDDITGKTDVPLLTRTNKANQAKADLFISFHHNANTAQWGTWTGTEVHVYNKCSNSSTAYKLASKVAPIIASTYGLKNRGVKKTNLHITRETKMTAILIEGGFMDSTIDIVKLRNNTILKNVGVAVADAVASFYGLEKKQTVTTVNPSTTTTSTTTTSNASTHTVVKGDTLYSIAKKYNTTVDNLKSWNGLKSNTLSIGQKLVVSVTKVNVDAHIGTMKCTCAIPLYSKPDGNGLQENFVRYLKAGSWWVYSIDYTNRMMNLGGNQWVRLADDFPKYMSFTRRTIKTTAPINLYSKPTPDSAYYVRKLPVGVWEIFAFDTNTKMVNLGGNHGNQWVLYDAGYVTFTA